MEEKVDHESNYEMGDSAMTIEFLRARLLSERSVSKSARRRADELADRVIELEEQLKAVSLQRKKAEKATSDVLSILETFGFSDNSEAFDSSSDQDITHPKTDKSRDIHQQGVESPNYFNRSLSWKSSKCSSHSERKFASASSRHNSSLSTDSSSHKHHRVGKSCRQVKRKEMRSTVDKLSNNDAISDESKLSRSNHEIQVEEQSAGDADSVCISSLRKLIDSEHQCHQNEGDDEEMERALEHQSELICRYEAEENAQIEWEQKYRENNSSTPESVEPGNQSDVTEERDEMKRQPVSVWPVNEDANSEEKVARVVNDVSVSLSNEVHPSRQTTVGSINYQNVDPEVYSQTSHRESAVPKNETKQIQEKPEGCSCHPSSAAVHQCLVSSSQAAAAGDNYHEGEASKTKPEKTIFVPHKPSKELGSVLEALQQAKLSLQHKLRNVPLPEDRYKGKAVHVRAMSSASRAQVPANCAALYRVPSDLQPDANVYKNNLNSRSQSTLMNHYYDSTSAMPPNEQFKSTSRAGAVRSHVWDGSSFDIFPNMKKNPPSNQGSGNKYPQSPSVLSNRSISHSDHSKFNPQNETQMYVQSPYRDSDSDFSFLTSDINKSGSQPEYNRSSFREIDLHVQSAFPNRLSSSSSDIQEFNSLRASAIRSSDSSHIENRQFVRNPQNVSRFSASSSPSQIHGSASSGSQQLFSPESDISLPSCARHSYHPSPPTVPDFSPPMPTFSGFPSFPTSPISDGNHGTGMYRN